MKHLRDKIAVVTGAASGIGKGIVESFIKAGMKVVLSDIEPAALTTTVKYYSSLGADVHGVIADVSKIDDIENLAQQTLKRHGAVHVLCNNAGVFAGSTPSWKSTLDDWNWIIGVNLMGVVHGVQTFLPIMIEQKEQAHIVNTSSIAGLILPGGALYRTTKTAIVALSESLQQELERDREKINISVLCPAMVDTNLLHSNRNRPPEFSNTGPDADKESIEKVKNAFKQGLKPEAVGDHVLQAILDEQFYILPNQEWKEQVMHRANLIVEGKRPSDRI